MRNTSSLLRHFNLWASMDIVSDAHLTRQARAFRSNHLIRPQNLTVDIMFFLTTAKCQTGHPLSKTRLLKYVNISYKRNTCFRGNCRPLHRLSARFSKLERHSHYLVFKNLLSSPTSYGSFVSLDIF